MVEECQPTMSESLMLSHMRVALVALCLKLCLASFITPWNHYMPPFDAHSGPIPEAIDSGTVSFLPQIQHEPSCQNSIPSLTCAPCSSMFQNHLNPAIDGALGLKELRVRTKS
jgi:hypothetical protein